MFAWKSKSSPWRPQSRRWPPGVGGRLWLTRSRRPLAPRRAMSAAERHSWRMPPLALLKPVAWLPGTKLGKLVLRGYPVISVLLLVVRPSSSAAAEPASRNPPRVAATAHRPRAAGDHQHGHAGRGGRALPQPCPCRDQHQPPAHAGCGQLVAGLAALARAVALLASGTSTSSARTYAGQAVMQSFAGLNIPLMLSAGPSPWAWPSSCRASASTRPGHSVARRFVLRDPLRPDPPVLLTRGPWAVELQRAPTTRQPTLSLATVMGSGANSVISLPRVMDDALGEQVEDGPAVHLPLEGFEPVDVAFG